jgi:FkbH-like protein
LACPALRAATDRLARNPDYSAHLALSSLLDSLTAVESGLEPLRIAVLRNFTIEPLMPVLKAQMVLAGFHPVVYMGDFDAIAGEVLDPVSRLYTFTPDIVILAQWLEPLAPRLTGRFASLSAEDVRDEVDRVSRTVAGLLGGVRSRLSAPVLLNNHPLPDFPALGILDAQAPGFQCGTILQLNAELGRIAAAHADTYVVDLMTLLARVGSGGGIDQRRWRAARAPLGREVLVPLGREYVKFIRAIRGRARKCLVLDCDDTLWGGVIGEDGVVGIQVGDSHPGSMFQDVQRQALALRDRGVLLALCSKNNEADVLEVLREHPGMLLRDTDLVAWQVNWDDKVTNLRRLAEQLNIGLDSLVFVDDNPFECDYVRAALPEVAVVHFAGDAAALRAELGEAGFFDQLAFSAEDRRRSEMYRADQERRSLEQRATSLEEYLADLAIVAEVGRAGPASRPRIAQLTQKTNQFNLTTRRYTESEIGSLAASADADVLFLSLRDRVAELGIVGVAILRYAEAAAEIDTFLLSCRALGRGAEQALLSWAMQAAAARGCVTVVGRYRPTAKNSQVAAFYERHGFTAVGATAAESVWRRAAAEVPMPPPWITTIVIEEGVHAE